MPTLRFRVQEWLAERYRFVQFPHQQLLPRRPPPPFFRNDLPWYLRFGLAVFGLVAIGIAVVVIGGIALLTWATLTS